MQTDRKIRVLLRKLTLLLNEKNGGYHGFLYSEICVWCVLIGLFCQSWWAFILSILGFCSFIFFYEFGVAILMLTFSLVWSIGITWMIWTEAGRPLMATVLFVPISLISFMFHSQAYVGQIGDYERKEIRGEVDVNIR